MSTVALIPKRSPSAAALRELRQWAPLSSFGQLKEAATNGTPVLTVEVFGQDWGAESRSLLREIEQRGAEDDAPFSIVLVDADAPGENAEAIGSGGLATCIEGWKETERQTRVATALDLGEIASPDDYSADSDDDW